MRKIVVLSLLLACSTLMARGERKQERCDKNYRKGLEYVKEGRNSRAVSVLSTVRLECIGGIAQPDTLYYNLGEAYLNGKKPSEARLEYRVIVEDYPHSAFLEEAAYKMAYCSYLAAPIIERDSRLLRRAMREFNLFISDYPQSKWVDTAQGFVDSIYTKLIEKEFANANYYEIVEKWDAAIIYYRSILEEFPGNDRSDEVKLQIVKSMVNGHRFTEAEKMMVDLEERGLYAEEIKSQRAKVKNFLAKIERQNKRKSERKDKNKKS